MEMKINVHRLRTDVTAVKFFKNYVLSGVGGCLKVHNVLTSQQLLDLEVFEGQKIHGIEIGTSPDHNIAVFGGRRIACFNLVDGESSLSVAHIVQWHISDWILSVKWLSACQIAIVTAHNEVMLWDLHTNERLQKVACTEKCIVYCALLVGNTWEELIALVGTVFQEIVVWAVGGKQNDDKPVLHRLTGHNGVIFSISHDAINGLISTTSDDRSVRLWSWYPDGFVLRHTLFGHRARAWRSVVRGGRIVSVGEDGLVFVWSVHDGKMVRRWNAHQNGRIWSLDVNEEHGLIVTGGGDGGISLWPLEGCSLAPLQLPFPSALVPRQVRLAQPGVSLAVTDSGCILHSSNKLDWDVVYSSANLASYCLMELSHCKNYAACATIYGSVLVFQIDYTDKCCVKKIIEENIIDGKIFSLNWLEMDEILVCGPNGKLIMLTLRTVTTCSLVPTCEFLLPASKERWITAATMYERSLVCGDRGGSVHRFSLLPSKCSTLPSEPTGAPCETLRRIHGHLGVCSLALCNGKLVSTGRDGMLRQYDQLKDSLVVEKTDKLPVAWAARLHHSSCGLLVLGFSEVKFVVWNYKEQRIVMEVDCGGGHRSWDFLVDAENVFHFIYVKDKSVHSISCPLHRLVKPVLQPGFHTKEIGCMQLLPNHPGSECTLISASEDTTIRISAATQTCILRGHISSVRALFTCQDPANARATLLFSGGGRAQLKVWRLGSTYTEVASHMLHPCEQRSWRDAPGNEPETRYMDIAVYNSAADIIALAGCSDGLLRLFRYKPASESLDLVSECSYHNRCILKVSHIKLRSNKHLALTMSTDGMCAFWQIPLEISRTDVLQPFAVLKLHQSGINSFDWVHLEDDTFLLATGGDDNALIVTLIAIVDAPALNVECLLQTAITSAHVAQITGVKFVDKYLVSTGIDQRVLVWCWSRLDGALTCTLVGRRVTTVSDVQGLLLWRRPGDVGNVLACAYGKGMEVMTIELNTKVQ